MPAYGRSRAIGLAYHQGDFLPVRDVALPPTLQALNYGTGVFEGIRCYWPRGSVQGYVFRLADHVDRMRASARTLCIDLDDHQIADAVIELLVRNRCCSDTYIRPIAYKHALEPGTRFGVRLGGISSLLTITTTVMGSYVPADGLRCTVSPFRRVPSTCIPSHAKVTGTYVNNALAVQDAESRGYDDALMLDGAGLLTEASTSNAFLILPGGRLVTPPVTSDILPGITRATVLQLASDLGLGTVAERPVAASEIAQAEELFLTGTGVEIASVISVDGVQVGSGRPGPVTRRLQSVYGQVVRGTLAQYAHWLTTVPSASTGLHHAT